MKQILSTKLLSEGDLIQAKLLSLKVNCVDFIRTNPVYFTIPEDSLFDTVVFTSTNALNVFLTDEQAFVLLKYKSIFSMSGKTKRCINEHGFRVIDSAENSVLLAAKIMAAGVKSVLHPCSKIRMNDMEQVLAKTEVVYTPLTVYDTQPLTVTIETDNYDALLFFSPSGIDSFLKNNTIGRKAICCCIGETTAEYLKAKQISNCIVYPQLPSISAMLSLVASYPKN